MPSTTCSPRVKSTLMIDQIRGSVICGVNACSLVGLDTRQHPRSDVRGHGSEDECGIMGP